MEQPTPVSTPAPLRVSPRLVGLNVALLMALGAVTLATRAGAQPDARDGARGRGEYTLVSGRIQGATTHTIYVLDAANQELVALSWNRNSNSPEVIGFRSLADDARYLQRPR